MRFFFWRVYLLPGLITTYNDKGTYWDILFLYQEEESVN